VPILLVVLAVVGWQLWRVPWVSAITPDPDAYIDSPTPEIVLRVRNLQELSDVKVIFAGRDVTDTTRLDGDRLLLSPERLADGTYEVRFSAHASNLFRQRVVEEWQFTVDTVDPTLDVDPLLGEGKINTDPAVFSGTTEPGAEVAVSADGIEGTTTAEDDGSFRLELTMDEGPATVLLTATDRAGNSVEQTLSLYVDASPPTLSVSKIRPVVDQNSVKVRIRADDGLRPPTVKATLDERPLEVDEPVASTRLHLKALAEGRHTLVVKASDRGGNEVKTTRVFVVDSTERFGAATLMPGARGEDVRELQRRLQRAGVFDADLSTRFGQKTEEAVLAFQKKFGLTADGIVGPAMLMSLSGHIVVDLSELKLYLYRDGALSRTYPVAAGTSEYPTPTGTYSVVSKVKDPTWYPPNSEWAKDAEPIPPGIANPLGTRWIGTSAPNVGIHGTPAASSIGTYASHGCIRMYISDVEELFERVAIGMPVVIRQ
jgi:peptidoglycan hydrolase-like protein with peptidoglycan-binding domain